jgi:malonate transporter
VAGALGGISTIWIVIGVGWLIAHLGMVNTPGRRLMSMLAFSVGSPALLFAMVSRASLDHLFSATVIVSALAIVVTGGVAIVLARFVFRGGVGDGVITFMASAYTNAANFGLPVAIALLGDATWMAPILLMQVAFLMPVCLAILDSQAARASGTKLSVGRYLVLPFRNPITIGILLGLACNLAGVQLPDWVMRPVDMIGDISVPLMLLAFGVSLRLDPLPGRGEHQAQTWTVVALKTLGHPLVAWGIGTAFGLSGPELYAVVVLGALPAAQNVHVIATRYHQSELVARDAVFWSTIASVGTLLGIAALLGGH